MTSSLLEEAQQYNNASFLLQRSLSAILENSCVQRVACPRLAVLSCELSASLTQAGSLYDELSRQAAAGTRLLLRDVLSIFLQVHQVVILKPAHQHLS